MTWTDERVERVTARWAEGASAGVIAEELGGLTRAAVIGKVHRLGLPKRTTQEAVEWTRSVTRRPRRSNRDVVGLIMNHAADQGKVTLPESKVPVEPADYRCTLLQLTNWTCRWPLGESLEAAKFFCGSPSADLQSHIPYCGFHSRYPYQVRTR